MKKKKYNPKISIIMVVHNEESTVMRSIKSILNQNFNKFELLIFDNNSIDKTKFFLRNMSFRDKRIKVFFSKKNIGLTKGLNFLLKKTKSEIIARIDGDDYWIGNSRIEKMVSFLEINPEYSMAFHDVYSFSNEDQTLKPFNEDKSKKDYTANDLLNGSFCYLLMGNMCLRNIKLDFPGEFYLVRNNDMFIPLFWGKHGGAKYLPEAGILGYRVHENGYWSGVNQREKQIEQVITGLQLVSFHLRNRNINAAIGHAKIRLAPLFNS